jgi:hypothetical protein
MKLLQRYARRPHLVSWLALLVLTTVIGYHQVAAQLAAPAAVVVAGSYAGTVAVSEPAPLGDLDLLLEITNANSQLTGQVNPLKTQVFLGGPTFTGSVTTNGVVTPTVRIESQSFSGNVSGRTVTRRFVLTGEVLNNGDILRGEYTETIVGFKPHPMAVKGTFLLARPSGVTAIVTVATPQGNPPVTPGPGGPPTATPTATATATVPAGNNGSAKLYLPLVQRGAAVNARAVVNGSEENEVPMVENAPTGTPSATPTPVVTETLTIATDTPTPTPLTLEASTSVTTNTIVTTTSVTTTTEAQQSILLPLIMQ